MQVKMSSDMLRKAVQVVNRAVSNNAGLSILQTILFEVNKNKLNLTATDMESFIQHRLIIDSADSDSFAIPAGITKEIVMALPDGEVSISHSDSTVKVEAEKSEFKIKTLPAEDYPRVQALDNAETITMLQPVLKDLIDKTVFACSNNETHHALAGPCLTIKKNKVTLVATDGRRLAVVCHNNVAEIENSQYILPAKGMKCLSSLLSSEGDVKIFIDKKLVRFELANTTVGIRAIEGNFPEYEKVMRQNSKMEIVLDVKAVIDATKRVALLAEEKFFSVKYSFNGDKLVISSKSEGIGEAEEELKVENSQDIKIAFNPAYMIDALERMGTEKAILELKDETSPAILKPSEESDHTQVIMPVQLSGAN